ncbi:hypothetical protein DSLASN_22990 [Desulfoluna limicola]|uniref:Uncharacterized protein n=1 Tax=Desulfoluna limicola TaxID=2810562 RepID=A0ABN6F5W0_9BACT|nr:hypothetical protein [Desulfoluna limicola]BCS96667.1 hypothetical protein DSLASN_22990 [Desulfoluna limicola]
MKRFIVHWIVLFLVVPISLVAAENGNVYRHPSGLSFWYPQQWALHELDEALQLVPADAAMSQEGPSEVYFVTGESVQGTGILQADDPRVIAYMDQQVRSILPALQLQHSRKAFALPGAHGIMLTWTGNNNAGKPVEGRAYVVVIKEYALTLSGISLQGLINKRTASLEKIFTSFVIGQGQLDPALAGTWHKHATMSVANPDRIYETSWSAAQAVTEDKSQLTFQSDGRWHRVDASQTLIGAGGLWLEDNSQNENTGRWNADGKRLFMLYDDNTWEEFAYTIVPTDNGRELRTAVGKEMVIWRQ